MKSVSSKQTEIYNFIVSFTKDHGYPPSVREIGAAVGLRSPSTVHTHLKSLKDSGMILKDERKTRALATPKSLGTLILGKVTAGQPIYAFEDDSGHLPYFPEDPGEHFALKVQGDSMINAGIVDGDYVIVRKQQTAESGEIVVALLEDEATVKRLRRRNGEVWLMPENPDYEPIDGNECSLIGKVTAVIREYC